jgi:LPS export ABC transporter protein LptC
VIILGMLALVLGALAACDRSSPETPPTLGDIPLQTIYGYHTVETHMGQVRWELFGERAERYAGEEDLRLFGVRMLFYEDGALSATLTSSRGRVDENTHDMTAEGDVLIVSEDGRTLSSEVLHWDNQRRLIHTELYFRATEGDQVLTGVGLETDPKMTDLVIKEQVEGELPAQSGEDGR